MLGEVQKSVPGWIATVDWLKEMILWYSGVLVRE